MKQITIDLDLVDPLVKEGGYFVFKPEAQESIVKFLDLYDLMQEKLKELKSAIEAAGLSIDPSFKGVKGARVKAMYRKFGAKYYIREGMEEGLERGGYAAAERKYHVLTEKVDKAIDHGRGIPEGIEIKERAPTISLTKNEKNQAQLQSPELIE